MVSVKYTNIWLLGYDFSCLIGIIFHDGRVLADGHIPWACEAFSQLHRLDLVQTPALLW